MSTRSTRNKIRFNAQSMVNYCDKMLERMYHMELLGADKIKAYQENKEVIVVAISILKETLVKFRSEF